MHVVSHKNGTLPGFLILIPKYARKHAEKHIFSLSVCMQMAKNRARYFPHDLLVEFPAPFSFASKDTFASSLCHHLILVVITERRNIANDNNKTRENENSSPCFVCNFAQKC